MPSVNQSVRFWAAAASNKGSERLANDKVPQGDEDHDRKGQSGNCGTRLLQEQRN